MVHFCASFLSPENFTMKKVILSLMLILFSMHMAAQPDHLSRPEPYFMALIVSNMDTSIAWYGEHLGFEVLNRTAQTDRGFRQSNLQCGSTLLELIELESAVMPAELLTDHPRATRVGGFFKFGFSVSDFDGWLAYLRDTGVQFRGDVVNDPYTKKRMIILLDPDGNRIQIFEK